MLSLYKCPTQRLVNLFIFKTEYFGFGTRERSTQGKYKAAKPATKC